MTKIIGVYKITNTVTGDFYIGSSKDVKRRWREHKCQSRWNDNSNNPMYLDMQRYGVEKFVFEILEVVEEGKLKDAEQKFIETLNPSYNDRNANGWDIERRKKTQKESRKKYQKSDKFKEAQKKYNKSDKGKKSQRKAQKKYQKSDKFKEAQKKYEKSDKRKKTKKEYNNQLCSYNGETLTLNALYIRFWRKGIEHPVLEAKKYLIKNNNPMEFYDVYP